MKGRISRVESQLREKADKTELTSAATFMRSEVEQLRNRVRKLASNELLGDLGFNERIKDGAAGLRRKVVFHCLSCDRPLLIESKGRSVFRQKVGKDFSFTF